MSEEFEYWKTVAARYRSERNMVLEENRILQRLLLEHTGKAYDGGDYLREIAKSATTPSLKQRIKNFSERIFRAG